MRLLLINASTRPNRSIVAVAELAEAAGLGCVPHVWGTGVGIMQGYHVAVGIPSIDMLEICTLENPLRDVMYLEQLPIEGGKIGLVDSPGLGVASLAEIERQFPYLRGRGHVIACSAPSRFARGQLEQGDKNMKYVTLAEAPEPVSQISCMIHSRPWR